MFLNGQADAVANCVSAASSATLVVMSRRQRQSAASATGAARADPRPRRRGHRSPLAAIGACAGVGYVVAIAGVGARHRRAQAGRQGRGRRSSTPPTARGSASSSPTTCARRSRRRTIPKIAQATRRSRSRTSASTSTTASTTEGVVRAAIKNIESRQDRPGRLDDHDAARPQPLHLQRADASSARSTRPSSPRSSRTSTARVDPRQVPQQRPVRDGRRPDGDRRRRPRRACSSTSRAEGAHARRGGAARRPAAGAVDLQPVPRTPSRRQGAPQRGAAQDGRARHDQPATEAATRSQRRSASSTNRLLHDAPRELLLRLRQAGADRPVRRQHRPPRRPAGLHDDRPRACRQAARRRSPASLADRATRRRRSSPIDPSNGYILAMASSASYGETKFNLAAQGRRQPGSTFKVMVLMAALRARRRPRRDDLHLQAAEVQRPALRARWKVKTYSQHATAAR